MENRTESLYWETILMETKVAKFYHLLSVLFMEDEGFWTELADEEENYAVLIHSSKDDFFEAGLFPWEAMGPDLLDIGNINFNLDEIMAQYEHMPPVKKVALLHALKFENSSRDYYFHLIKDRPTKNPEVELIRTIAETKMHHAQKLAKKLQSSLQSTS
jgi:hypothetical protein